MEIHLAYPMLLLVETVMTLYLSQRTHNKRGRELVILHYVLLKDFIFSVNFCSCVIILAKLLFMIDQDKST